MNGIVWKTVSSYPRAFPARLKVRNARHEIERQIGHPLQEVLDVLQGQWVDLDVPLSRLQQLAHVVHVRIVLVAL